MLPERKAQNFPEALKLARESRRLSYTGIAKLIDISPVMPSRYENREHSCFVSPSQKTWEKLNTVLFGKVLENDNTVVKEEDERIYLDEASVEELIKELKSRGATNVNVSF